MTQFLCLLWLINIPLCVCTHTHQIFIHSCVNVYLSSFHVLAIVKKKMMLLSRVWLFATPWTIACQAPPPWNFSRQGCWNGLPFPSPGDLPEPRFPTLQANSSPSEPPGEPKVKVKLVQSCLTLCIAIDRMVHGILQASILKWVAYCFSSGSSRLRDRTQVSYIAGRFFTN